MTNNMDYSKIAKFIIAILLLLAFPIIGLGSLSYLIGDGFVIGCKAGIGVDILLITVFFAVLAFHYIVDELD
jgi:hypothetical protein